MGAATSTCCCAPDNKSDDECWRQKEYNTPRGVPLDAAPAYQKNSAITMSVSSQATISPDSTYFRPSGHAYHDAHTLEDLSPRSTHGIEHASTMISVTGDEQEHRR